MKLATLFILSFVYHSLQGQKVYAEHVDITFENGVYALQRAVFYHDESKSNPREDRFSLVMKGFEAMNFEEYSKLFFTGECHVSEDDWHSWKVNYGQHRPEILANFTFSHGKMLYGVTKYALSVQNKKYLIAQLHKQVNGQWYYVSADENLDRIDLIMFCTALQESFFKNLKTDRSSVFLTPGLANHQGFINGTALVGSFNDRYRPKSRLYQALNLVFEEKIKVMEDARASEALLATRVMDCFQSTLISEEERSYLENLLKASQTGAAVSHYAKITGVPIEQFILECPNLLKR